MKIRYRTESTCYNPLIVESYKNVSTVINRTIDRYSETGDVEVVDVSTVPMNGLAYVNITLKVTEYEPWEIE